MIIEIGNYEYFTAIDNQVRHTFAQFEKTVMKEKLNAIYRANEIASDRIRQYPVEGYYYKNPP